ncbi:hypothetical protein K3728_18660 [Rhodobacteraceae bacterium M385]|nr:hypothetical protein K3728_18660 [Rhodobacteraceae bacterium M385]
MNVANFIVFLSVFAQYDTRNSAPQNVAQKRQTCQKLGDIFIDPPENGPIYRRAMRQRKRRSNLGAEMKVETIHDDPVALDLVAHFLGIADHDNINAAPSGRATRKKNRTVVKA